MLKPQEHMMVPNNDGHKIRGFEVHQKTIFNKFFESFLTFYRGN